MNVVEFKNDVNTNQIFFLSFEIIYILYYIEIFQIFLNFKYIFIYKNYID